MKTLKRTLCLVLALVLALSTMAVASAAVVLKDKNEINPKYAEAVEVMNALGIIVGDQNGYFDPNGTLTRAQAAKLVSFVAYGNSVASLKSGSVCRFEDVADNSWASAWIELMAETGAINGESATKFNPDGKLTGIAWAKLLLVALGYGQGNKFTEEVFVGPKWMFNVEKIANSENVKLLRDMDEDFDLFDEITREEAAQMAFTAMLTKYNRDEVKHYVSDGNGGYAVMTVDTPVDLEYLAVYNYGLDWYEGVVYGDTMYKTESVEKFVLAAKSGTVEPKSATTEGMVEEYLETEPVELTASLDAPHHAGCWTAVGKDGKSYQITDLVIFDESYGVKNDDIKAWKTAHDAELNDALKTKWDNAHFEAPYVYNFQNAKPVASLNAAGMLGYKIDENETLTAYNFNAVKTYKSAAADADIDAVVSQKWYVAKVSAADVVKATDDDKAYAGKTRFVFEVVNSTAKYTVYGAEGDYAKNSFYTIVPNELYKVLNGKFDDGTLVALYGSNYTQVAENVFLKAPKALDAKIVTVSAVNIKGGVKTFVTSAGSYVTSAGDQYDFYAGNQSKKLNGVGLYSLDEGETSKKYFDDFNFVFYFDQNKEVVAYEIVADTEYVGYIANYALQKGETRVLGVDKTETDYTIVANIVLEDGSIKTLPVSYRTQDDQVVIYYSEHSFFKGLMDWTWYKEEKLNTLTEAQNWVLKMNQNLNDPRNADDRIGFFALMNNNAYSVAGYACAESFVLTDEAAKAGVADFAVYPNGHFVYNYSKDTKIFNVTVKNEYPVVTVMDKLVGGERVYNLLDDANKNLQPATETKYTYEYKVNTVYYDGYEAPTTSSATAFIVPGMNKYDGYVSSTSSSDGNLNIVDAKVYFGDALTDVTFIDDTDISDAFTKGGFYTVTKNLKTGYYTLGAAVDFVITEVTRLGSDNKFNFVAFDADVSAEELHTRNATSFGPFYYALGYVDPVNQIAQVPVIDVNADSDGKYPLKAWKYDETSVEFVWSQFDAANKEQMKKAFGDGGFVVSLVGAEEDGFVGYYLNGTSGNFTADFLAD